ncbi:MAG: hypothetical protein COA47_07460 [Robiginitomaculum sp.]|nr:MAG: hypothetical protein COA47_07460 [Robiginitomaculum sp.]
MSHVQHELVQKFPEKKEQIHNLKMNDSHFARLFDEYHELNRRVHRIESRGTDRSDETMEDIKKQRIILLDELINILEK